MNAVLRGEQFVGRRFADHDFTGVSDAGASEGLRSKSVFAPLQQSMEIARRHEAGFHSDDASLLDDITQFIGTALRPGMQLSSSRPSHTGTAFFQDCRHMAWILLLRLSRGDISRWMLVTRSRHS